MGNKILLTIMLGIMFLGLASANLGEFKQGECINIITNLNSSSVNISQIVSPSPNSAILINNKAMTNLGGGTFNYTFCSTSKLGRYTYGYCDYSNSECYSNDFTITSIGEQNDKGITEFVGILFLALIICIFCYLKISRFLGSMGIFVIGFGILFRNSLYGWLGWIIIIIAFLTMILSLMTPKTNKGPIRRRF